MYQVSEVLCSVCVCCDVLQLVDKMVVTPVGLYCGECWYGPKEDGMAETKASVTLERVREDTLQFAYVELDVWTTPFDGRSCTKVTLPLETARKLWHDLGEMLQRLDGEG